MSLKIMQVSDLEHFRDLLDERKQALAEWLNSAASVRRDDIKNVQLLLTQIKDALDRVDNLSYGDCSICHGEIELHRLEVQPARRVCLDCITDDEKTALEEDLYLASKIHRALLPQAIPEIGGFEVGVRTRAARDIGGDYFDFLPDANGLRSRVVIGDAMGKGMPAGLLMSNLQGALRILSSEVGSPSSLMTRLNQWLCRNVPITKFVSLLCVSLEPASDSETRLVYANAGHCPPILMRSEGSVERLEATGGVLGVHEGFTYEERSVALFPGDILTLYTDGITEMVNTRGEMFEEERLIQFLSRHRTDSTEAIVDKLIEEALDFSGNSQADDDLTVIVLLKR